MRSNMILIVSVLAAVLIIGAAVMLAGQRQGMDAGGLNPAGDSVVIPPAHAACAEGEQCIVVDTHCGFCCKYEAINARFEADFNRNFDKSCRSYGGQTCQCFDLSSFPSCVAGRCQLVKWPESRPATEQQAAPEVPPPAQEQPAPPPQAAPPEMALPQTQTPPPEAPAALSEPLPAERAMDDDLLAPLPETPPDSAMPREQIPDGLDAPLPAGNPLP